MKLLIAAIIAVVLLACTDTERTVALLESQGYTNVTTEGYGMFSCGRDETCTKFTATNPMGRQVTGVVGCGYTGCSKACTVRFMP